MNDEFKLVPESQYCLTEGEKIMRICEGCLAYRDGLRPENNPYHYPDQRNSARLWLEGFCKASLIEDKRQDELTKRAKSVYVYAPQY